MSSEKFKAIFFATSGLAAFLGTLIGSGDMTISVLVAVGVVVFSWGLSEILGVE